MEAVHSAAAIATGDGAEAYNLMSARFERRLIRMPFQMNPQEFFAALERSGRVAAMRPASIEERWEQILRLADLGRELERSAPRPEGLKRVRDRHEAAWQQVNARLMQHAGV